MTSQPASLDLLAQDLDVGLSPTGEPARPLVFLPLDRWRDAPAEQIVAAAGLVAGALPITVGVLDGPPDLSLWPLMGALTLTLAGGQGTEDGLPVVRVADLDGMDSPHAAAAHLRACVEQSPRAALTCGQLLRQTTGLDTTPALAAEAAAYSMLLGGPEFARWLAARGAHRPRPAPADPVRVSRHGAQLSIVLDDPARRNAFSMRLREALLDAVLLAEADETITCVNLRGAGEAFCSGGDLGEFGTATDFVAAYLVRLDRAPWRVIDRIRAKVTARVHGACIGAGTEITAFAGQVIAAPDAFFALPEVGMGLVPGAGGSVSVPRRIGRWRAAWLMLTGDRLPAGTAARWGLVDEIGPRVST
jgi:enoyl-CoA hydratase/carnithine racemase